MPAATPDTEPVATTHDANPRRSTGQRSHSWPVLPLALVGWFVGLLPWFVARRTVGTFGTPWNPRNDMREALLPFHHDREIGVVEHVFAGDADDLVETFRADLYSASFDARRLLLE